MHPSERLHLAQSPRRTTHRLHVINKRCLMRAQSSEQLLALLPPPGHRAHSVALGSQENLFPRRSQHRIARYRPNQQLVELLDEPVTLALVHDKREIEVVGGLA